MLIGGRSCGWGRECGAVTVDVIGHRINKDEDIKSTEHTFI